MNEIPNLIKELAKSAVEQDKPVAVIMGKVMNKKPLIIETEQKLTIKNDFIIFPKSLKSYKWEEGENVVMIRCDGGQRYLLIDLV